MSFKDDIRKEINSAYIIGAYHREGTRAYFNDLRGAAGERIENFDGTPIEDKVYVGRTDLTEDEFYEFDWDIEGDEVEYYYKCLGNIRLVNKARMLRVRLDEKLSQRGTNRKDANQNQKMINQEVTGAPHTYIYELLQNSNDYPLKDANNGKIPVEVKFILTEHYLFFIHSGAPFNLRNIAAICTVNEGEKRDNTETIGYKGMGFKSVFVNNDYVFLSSGGWNLRFDDKEIKRLSRFTLNWQYMPIPTSLTDDIDDEIKVVLSELPSHMNVFFALRHQRDAKENIPNLEKVFSDDRILVFIPHVDHVEVWFDGKLQYDCYKDRQHWLIKNDIRIEVDETYKTILEESLKTDKKIPEKFQKIKEISVAFAVQREGNRLIPIPVESSQVYNYLPTEQHLYLPFLINADFVPDASRKSLPEHKWNHKVLEDAGRQYAQWWTSLMLGGENYDLESIFDLLPDFRAGDNFRASFMKGFEEELGKIKCIPIDRNGVRVLVPLNEIIFDNMGFVVSDNPVMSDVDFYVLLGIGDKHEFLPHPEVREHPNLKMLLDYYSSKGNIGRVLSNCDIVTILRAAGFEAWAKNEAHATNLYRYLFDSQKINNILHAFDKIFLTEAGTIESPTSIYRNIDDALEELYMFEDRLPRLKKTIREALPDGFSKISFKIFDASAKALELSANFDKNGDASRIQNVHDSVHFLNFLATAKYGSSAYTGGMPKTMPLYLNDGVSSGKENVYIENELGVTLSKQPWIKDEWIHFIHEDYTRHSDDLIRFLTRCGITTISPAMVWDSFIADRERSQHIISAIGAKQANIGFFNFLTKIEKEVRFNDVTKNKYHIWVNDGERDAYVPLSSVIYWSDSRERDNLLKEEWLPEMACLAIDDAYLSQFSGECRNALERIFKGNGIVEDFSVSGWIRKCMVKEHLWPEIIQRVTSTEISIRLLDFLYLNRVVVAEIGKAKLKLIPLSLEGFAEMMPLCEIKQTVYQRSDDLVNLSVEPWFPSNELTSVADAYCDLFDGIERRKFFDGIGIREFDMDQYVQNVILVDLTNYNCNSDKENAFETNVSFHKFFANPTLRLSDNDYEKLKHTPVFTILPGKEECENEAGLCEVCTGFFLPSDRLGRLVELDIAPVSILHTIRPEYFAGDAEKMTVYFKDKLGNRQLHDNELVKHLIAHKAEIIPYISEYNRNLRFWQWAAQSSTTAKEREAFRNFPMYDSERSLMQPNELYASAVYSKNKDAEQMIRRFIPDAHFILEDYAKIESEEEIDWLGLFRNIKISISAEYVLLNKVLPKLNEYASEQDDVILALAGILGALKAEYAADSKKIEGYLQNLYVKCNDKKYRKIGEVILSGAYQGIESGKYPDIELPQQISEDYLKATDDNAALRSSVINFFQFLIDKTNVEVIKTAKELAAKKVAHFLENQNDYAKTEAHYRIIGELAEDCFQSVGWTEIVLKGKHLLLYSSNGSLVSMDKATLYLGSIYHPTCDFQANGIAYIPFISDKYREYADLSSIRRFLTNKGYVKWGFHGESEMKFLENPTFSIYFWSNFLPSQLKDKISQDHFNRILTSDSLEKYKCIPTGGGMKKPSQVYNPADKQLVGMIKVMEKQDEYLATVNIPLEYSKGFAQKLTEMDCLEFLRKSENDKGNNKDRIKVCEWLAELQETVLTNEFKENLNRFVEAALWRNGAKEWVPLKNLYILERTEDSKLIVEHFGGSECVCLGASLPESNTVLQKLCSLFGIPLLHKDDFDYKTAGTVFEDTQEISELQKRLVYLSYSENRDGEWESKYLERQSKLDKAKIEGCEEIKYFYGDNENLYTSLSFLDNGDSGFAYKNGRKPQMFESRLNWAIKTFDLKSSHISVLQELFLENFSDYVKKHDGGSLPPNVLAYLPESDKERIGEDKIDEQPEDLEGPFVSEASVPESEPNHAPQEYLKDISDSDETSYGINDKGSNREVDTNEGVGRNDGSEDSLRDPESNPTQLKDSSKQQLFSDVQDREHEDNHKPGQSNPASGSSSNAPQISVTPEESFEERSRRRWEQRREAKVTPPTSAQPTHKVNEEIVDIEDNTDTTPNYGDVFDPNSSATINKGASSTASCRRAFVDKELDNARKKAKEEEEKQDRRRKLLELQPYTLEWFNYLIDMQREPVKESKERVRCLDFYDWKLIDKESQLYRLVSPSSFIPSNLAEASNVRIAVINNGKTHVLNAEILESDETGIDLRCGSHFGTPSATRWIRIEYQNVKGFSEAQAIRFSQLNRDWNLSTRLDQKIPSNLEFIYGPPGTGKTTELVKRISEALQANPCYNILVVTPTNRAADEIAERLVKDEFSKSYLSRYGVTESRDLIRNNPDVLKNRQTMDLKKSNKNVMVTTIARYPYDSVQPCGEAIFDLRWDLIIVDEASMIDIVPITLLLVNNKAEKFIIAGDPKQIRPVKPSFDYPDEYVFNIYDMIGMNSFKEAAEGRCRYPVMALDTQHRSVPSIGQLVSTFSYDGILKNDLNRGEWKILNIPGLKVEPLNVIGYEVIPMSHLYDFNKVDNSWVHVYSAIFAYEFAAHIAGVVSSYTENRHYSIGIVSPYKKQAAAIQEMLASRRIDTAKCSVRCGTVHKFQGSECDIMIVVMNYPDTHSGQDANVNNSNIMNVAMSRARDYVFFLSPEKGKEDKAIYLMNDVLFRQLPKGFNFVHAHALEKVMFGDETFIAKNASLKSHLSVNVSTPTGKRYEVRISDTALDIQINDER